MNKIITYTVDNRFLDEVVFTLTMPYNPYKSIYGYYSKLWKRLKKVFCETENATQNNIKIKTIIIKGKTKRVIYKWSNGVVLDMPNDATESDYDIVIAQFEVFKMSCKK